MTRWRVNGPSARSFNQRFKFDLGEVWRICCSGVPAWKSLGDWWEARKPPPQNWDCEMTIKGKIKGKGKQGEILESHLQNRITGWASVAAFKVLFVISLSLGPHNAKWRQMLQFSKSLYFKMNLHASIFIKMPFCLAQMKLWVKKKEKKNSKVHTNVFKLKIISGWFQSC